MKKSLLILGLLITSTLFVFGQLATLPGNGYAQAAQAAKTTLEFTAEVSGEYLIINFEVIPQSGYQIELYDITGRRVACYNSEKGANKRMEFSLNQALGKGLYIVRISSGKQAAAKKIQMQ